MKKKVVTILRSADDEPKNCERTYGFHPDVQYTDFDSLHLYDLTTGKFLSDK